jgi:hypothetical protein
VNEEAKEEGRKKAGLMPGLILIILGVAFLALQFVQEGWGPGVIFMVLGVILVIGAAITHNLGLYVPGFTLLGLGTGLAALGMLPDEGQNWPFILIGLGLGFLAIWPTVTMPQKQHPWPLYPGGILTVLGFLFLMGEYGILGLTTESVARVLQWWPLVLVVIGVVLVYQWFRGKEQED